MKLLQAEHVVKGLSDAGTGEVEKKNNRTRGRSSEQLSNREWAELMGTNRPTHRRVKGRVKQR